MLHCVPCGKGEADRVQSRAVVHLQEAQLPYSVLINCEAYYFRHDCACTSNSCSRVRSMHNAILQATTMRGQDMRKLAFLPA